MAIVICRRARGLAPCPDLILGWRHSPSTPKSSLDVALAGWAALAIAFLAAGPLLAVDHVRELQTHATVSGQATWGYWGPNPADYLAWGTHSNRLIPIYTFGATLDDYRGARSIYRDERRVRDLYGFLPRGTVNPEAEYFDQTDVARLQESAATNGKKRVILIVFDGMDWQTTFAAAIHASGKVGYHEGRGTGLAFQDYRGTTTDFGYFVTSPFCEDPTFDPDRQTIDYSLKPPLGGYDAQFGGRTPWSIPADPLYLIGQFPPQPHAFTDSASSATSLTAGVKTFNGAINVDRGGRHVEPIARKLQRQGWGVGVVTSVPISHATPACAYANNVSRDDYQDLTRDLLGLPSIAHRSEPLPGVDVLLGAGWGETVEVDAAQGTNFRPGNRYLTDEDAKAIDIDQGLAGSRYVVSRRTAGQKGAESLADAARRAASEGRRLFGYYGAFLGHLPFRTADGGYDPTFGRLIVRESYTPETLAENPTLADMATAALTVLEMNPKGFWLMIEAGDVDWANHDNNIDNSIGAVISGDLAFRSVVDWVDARRAWDETLVIVTADHGHYLNLVQPEALLP